MIYFPGNAGHRGHRMIEMDLLSRLGVDVYLFDYRGYGDNSGRPTEANLAQDAHVLWNAVTADRKTDPRHVVLLGESLGGGVATRLADELCNEGTPPAGLVLRSTFSSLADVAAYHYRWLPVRLLLVDRFLSTERIGSVRCPILIFHGTEDTIIPLAFAQRLFAAAPAVSANRTPKAFVALPGANHNDLVQVAGSQYREQLRAFFAGIERSGAELAIRLLSDPAPR